MNYSVKDLEKAISVYEGMLSNPEVDTYINIAIDCMKKQLYSKEEMLLLKHKRFVESTYHKWLSENNIENRVLGFVTFLDDADWLNRDNVLFDFQQDEKMNRIKEGLQSV